MTIPVKFALLGCGRVSARYLEVFSDEITGGVISACIDHVPEKAEDAASRIGGDVQVMTSIDQLIDGPHPDVACVLTESGNHYEHARQLLEAGINVIVEKPVTLIPEQAYELGTLASSNGLMLSVVKQNRWNPAIRKLRETLDSGRFGNLITATVRLRWCRYQDYYEDGWHGTWAMDGGVINQQAIHHVDALNWLCGPISHVSAHGAQRLMELEAEDTMVAAVRFENGALGTIEATTAARPRDFEASLSVIGEGGMVEIGGIALNQILQWSFVEPLPEDDTVPDKFSQEVPTGYGLSHAPYIQEVIDRIAAGNRTPPLAAEEGVKALEVIHGLYASMEQNAWISLSDKPRSAHLGQG